MRRAAFILVGAAAGAAALAAAWWWGTAPPVSDAVALGDAAAAVPADADGLLVVAQPDRAARWLLRRPQAAALLAVAAPDAQSALARLRAVVATLGGESRGPLTVWWRGGGMAAAAEVGDGSARALRRLAALEDLAVRTAPAAPGTVTVAIASDAVLLDGPAGGRPQPGGSDRIAGLARVGARWWRLQVTRDRLDLVDGAAPELPPPAGPSVVVTADLGRLAGLASPSSVLPHVPLGLAFGPSGWALALPGVVPGPEVRKLLALGGDTAAASTAGVRRWRGVLGELWVRPGTELAIASNASMLAALPAPPYAGESGMVRGGELSGACLRAADALDALFVLGSRGAAFRRAAPEVAAVRLARWRILPSGGTIRLEW